jgi:hypothetical protein
MSAEARQFRAGIALSAIESPVASNPFGEMANGPNATTAQKAAINCRVAGYIGTGIVPLAARRLARYRPGLGRFGSAPQPPSLGFDATPAIADIRRLLAIRAHRWGSRSSQASNNRQRLARAGDQCSFGAL